MQRLQEIASGSLKASDLATVLKMIENHEMLLWQVLKTIRDDSFIDQLLNIFTLGKRDEKLEFSNYPQRLGYIQTPYWISGHIAEYLLNQKDSLSKQSLVEFGSGEGRNTEVLDAHHLFRTISGIEYQTALVTQASRNNALNRFSQHRVHYIQTNGFDLVYRRVHWLLMYQPLNIHETLRFLRKIKKELDPGSFPFHLISISHFIIPAIKQSGWLKPIAEIVPLEHTGSKNLHTLVWESI